MPRISVSGSLENIRKHIANEPDAIKRAQMAREARVLRGHGDMIKEIQPIIKKVSLPQP